MNYNYAPGEHNGSLINFKGNIYGEKEELLDGKGKLIKITKQRYRFIIMLRRLVKNPFFLMIASIFLIFISIILN